MRAEGLNRWPDRSERRDLYTHNLSVLLKKAGLDAAMLDEMVATTDIGIAWAVSKDWSYNSRYATGLKPRDARDIVRAIHEAGGIGLLRWIIETN